MGKKLTTNQKKLRWAKQAIRKNPTWGRDKLNKEIKSRYGSGFKKQDLSDLKHAVLHTAPKTEVARERVFEKRITKKFKPTRLRIPSDLVSSPRVTKDYKHHKKYAVPINKMPRPDLPHHFFADIEFPVPVATKKGATTTRYASVMIGTMDRDDMVRAFRNGNADKIISDTVIKEYGVPEQRIDFSITGFWATKQVIT